MDPTVLLDHTGPIALVTLNRPAVRNALSRQLATDLLATLTALSHDDTLRALILTGAGDRAFCAGADLIERQTMTPAELTAHTESINTVCDTLESFPVPTIAAIRGYALAGGAEIAIACDLRVAATDATLGFPEVKIGVFPGAGGVVRLPLLIGPGPARDLLYTGRQVPADEAHHLGLITRLVPPDQVLPTAQSLASTIAANAPLAIRALKRALLASTNLPTPDAHRTVAHHRRPLDATSDYTEGLTAFAERRKPNFKAR